MTKKASSQAYATHSQAIRYHSLAGERCSIASCLEISAECIEDGEIMGVRHVKYPIEGVQFHPESISAKTANLSLKIFWRAHGDDSGKAYRNSLKATA